MYTRIESYEGGEVASVMECMNSPTSLAFSPVKIPAASAFSANRILFLALSRIPSPTSNQRTRLSMSWVGIEPLTKGTSCVPHRYARTLGVTNLGAPGVSYDRTS